MSDRKFLGVWIPAEIWLHTGLSILDKCMLTEISSLSKADGGCFASNEYFAQFMGQSVATIKRSIAKLTAMGYIINRGTDGRKRRLEVRLNNNRQPAQNEPDTADEAQNEPSDGSKCTPINLVYYNTPLCTTYTSPQGDGTYRPDGQTGAPVTASADTHTASDADAQPTLSLTADTAARIEVGSSEDKVAVGRLPQPAGTPQPERLPSTGKRPKGALRATRASEKAPVDYDTEFETLWQQYPKEAAKGRKSTSRDRYVKARRAGTSAEEIADGLRRYIRHVEAERKRGFYNLRYKNAETWFNRHWEDTYPTDDQPVAEPPKPEPQPKSQPEPKPQKTVYEERLYDNADDLLRDIEADHAKAAKNAPAPAVPTNPAYAERLYDNIDDLLRDIEADHTAALRDNA